MQELMHGPFCQKGWLYHDNNDIVLIQFTLLCSMYTLCICWDKFYESKAVNTKFFSRLGNTKYLIS